MKNMNKFLNVGTKIFYDRYFLFKCRNFLLIKSFFVNMVKIFGIIIFGVVDISKENGI